jgi:hypothetical protein
LRLVHPRLKKKMQDPLKGMEEEEVEVGVVVVAGSWNGSEVEVEGRKSVTR